MKRLLQPVGAWYDPAVTDFIVWAPLAESVQLFHANARHAMRRAGEYWKISLQVSINDRYGFCIDNGDVLPDPASLSQPDGVHGLSAVVDRRRFTETVAGWQGIPLSNAVIYELHTGAFCPTHDFDGIIQRLEYFQQLGVNVLEIMPLAQCPGDRNWGYDGVFPFAIQHSYGGIGGFHRLVEAAHRKGIAVIVDVVYNHLGPEGNRLPHFGPYFTERYKTPWGSAINFDGPYSDGVRNYFLSNACLWLEELHADGLRLDAVHAILDTSAVPFVLQLKELATDIGMLTGRPKLVIAEMDLNDPRFINPPSKGGYGLDAQWNDEFHHALRALMTGETRSYYSDFGSIAQLEKAFRNTYVYDGVYSPHRKRTFGGRADHIPYDQFVVFAQNHDQVGNRARGERLGAWLNFQQLKLAAATVLLSPYVPLLFMGEEYGETHPFQYFASFNDPALIQSIREGRAAEFADFSDGSPLADPQAGSTFLESQLAWWQAVEEPGATLLRYYKHLIRFRQTRPALQGRTRDTMIVHPALRQTLAIERKILNDHIFIWFHYGDSAVTHENITWQHLTKIFDSADECWNGPGSTAAIDLPSGASIHIAPQSVVIYEKKRN
ncbi:MAG TPA: malto-oligosyltrehalose trehalohydrolase [Puia sp.]|uniref:malto-oligosyltrehalose trehalohydrolase n=1 Tax=Puia sp. TaxID=2045100 RepID=UPI002B7C78D4|nr:malto-oligosyltrehalose trehalohydrolase [Puia sp.]HVU96136.1 malto-oligosyltrehalose trehalohydrolase [Puia sp.]